VSHVEAFQVSENLSKFTGPIKFVTIGTLNILMTNVMIRWVKNLIDCKYGTSTPVGRKIPHSIKKNYIFYNWTQFIAESFNASIYKYINSILLSTVDISKVAKSRKLHYLVPILGQRKVIFKFI